MELTSQEVALLSQKCGLEEESIIKQHAVFLGPKQIIRLYNYT